MSVCVFHSQIPIPGHNRSDSTSSDPFPPSPSSYQRKFSPPASPRSPRSPRPPSPLLSDHRVSGSGRNSSPHSSTSSSPGNDGYLATTATATTRQRTTSLKEKVRCIYLSILSCSTILQNVWALFGNSMRPFLCCECTPKQCSKNCRLIVLPSLPPTQGIALFQRRQQEVASHSEQDSQRRKRYLSVLKGLQEDDTLSPDDKILFAETLREVGIM